MSPEPISLHHGHLTFSALSSGEGPLVLLLHGFPDTPATFGEQITGLAQAGYRVIAPVLRGYEPSSQPSDGDYHAVRMAEDVVAWLDDLHIERAHLVGHDWGANIAYAAASLAPERLLSLATLAVPHPVRFSEAYARDTEQQQRAAYILAFQQTGFEARLVENGCAYLLELWRQWSPGWAAPQTLIDELLQAFEQPGVARAALEYYRQAFDVESPAALAGAALFSRPITVPTLGICGSNDGCIAAQIFRSAMQEADFPAGLRIVTVDGAGHFLHAEAPADVNRLLINWFEAPGG